MTHQNNQSPHLKFHLELKTREDVEGSDLGLQRGVITQKWKNMFGKETFARPYRDSETQKEILSRFFWTPSYLSHLIHILLILIYGDSALPEIGPLSTFI